MAKIHYVMLVCSALAAGLPALAEAFPAGASPYLKGATAILVLLAGVLGVVSPSASLGASPPAEPKP